MPVEIGSARPIYVALALPVCLLYLIKNSTFAEMDLLRLLPASEHFINGEQFDSGKSF